MPDPYFWTAVLIISLGVLTKSADMLLDAASSIAAENRLSSLLIGSTLVAGITALPELAASLLYQVQGNTRLLAPHIIGSSISNLLLVLGTVAIIGKTVATAYRTAQHDQHFLIGTIFLLTLVSWDGTIHALESGLLLITAAIYLVTAARTERAGGEVPSLQNGGAGWKEYTTALLTAAFIYLGTQYILLAARHLAPALTLQPAILTAGIVALGTTLPEALISITAIRQQQPQLAIGTLIGSTILTSSAVTGLAGVFHSLPVHPAVLHQALPPMIAAALLYTLFSQDDTITRQEGIILLLIYLFFLGNLLLVAT